MHVGHAFATIHLHCSRWIFMVLHAPTTATTMSLYATCIHTFVQRLSLPRQAARRRSCCNLYAKLFYKLSKKDGVSRKHSRCCTHTHTHDCKLVQSGANKLACRISLDFSFNCNSKRASASAWACRLSEILIDTHNLFCQIPCSCMIV